MNDILNQILDQLKELGNEVKGQRGELNDLRNDVQAIREEHGGLLRVLEHRAEVTSANIVRLQEDVTYLTGSVNHLKGDMDQLKDDIGQLKGKVDHLQNDVTEIKENLLDLEDGLKFALLKIAQYDARIKRATS